MCALPRGSDKLTSGREVMRQELALITPNGGVLLAQLGVRHDQTGTCVRLPLVPSRHFSTGVQAEEGLEASKHRSTDKWVGGACVEETDKVFARLLTREVNLVVPG